MRPRKLTTIMIEAKVNKMNRRCTGVQKCAAVRKGGKFLVGDGHSSSAAFPRRTRNDVEIARGEAPPSLRDVSSDGPKRLLPPVPPMRPIDGEKSHRWSVSRTAPMAKVESDRHGLRIKVGRAARARLAAQPREENATSGPCGPIATLSCSRPTRVKEMAVPGRAKPRTKTTRMSRISHGPADLVEHDVRGRVASAKQRVEYVVPRGDNSLMLVGTRLAVSAPPSGRVPYKKRLAARRQRRRRGQQGRDQLLSTGGRGRRRIDGGSRRVGGRHGVKAEAWTGR